MRTGAMNRYVAGSAGTHYLHPGTCVFVLDQRATIEASPECLPSPAERYLFVIPIDEDWGMFVPSDSIDF